MAKQSKAQRILTHGQVWTALDRLAERAGLSPSGLAKRAGLDPTTFNKSKRITADGRERWPSTESVAKALAATNSSIDTFVQLIGDGARGLQSVPLLGLAQAGSGGHFDDSGLSGRQGLGRGGAALGQRRARLCAGDFRRFDEARLSRRRRHRGVAGHADPPRRPRGGENHGGEVMVKELKRRTAKTLELQSLNPAHADRTVDADDVAWIARIVWASQ